MSSPNRTLSFLAGSAANPQFKDNAFVYQYDARSRIQRKHIPPAGWTELVYDRLDRPVMSQDEQDCAQGQWRYMLYDGLSRVVQTGRMALSRSATDLRMDFAGVDYETYPATVNPLETSQLTVSQYDTYRGALMGTFKKRYINRHNSRKNVSGNGRLLKTYSERV